MPGEKKGGAKERIFLAAVRVFAAKGFKGATVRDICREAGGVNLNAVNYYYGGKKKLYQAILELLFTEGDRQMRERLAEVGEVSPEQRLRVLLEVCCRLFFSGCEVSAAFMALTRQRPSRTPEAARQVSTSRVMLINPRRAGTLNHSSLR